MKASQLYLWQRITAVAMLGLTPWFLITLYGLDCSNYTITAAYFAAPWRATLLLVLLWSALFHGYLGLETICKDYISCPCFRKGIIISLITGTVFVSILVTLCIIKIVARGV